MSERPIRVLVSKCGLDGHDRGVRVIARALTDGGMEVIYGGLQQTPEMVAEIAVQEDVDAVGLSVHSAAHMTLFPKVKRLLDEAGASHVLLTGGGIIPDDDAQKLLDLGVGKLFGPGAPLEDIVTYVRDEVGKRRSSDAP